MNDTTNNILSADEVKKLIQQNTGDAKKEMNEETKKFLNQVLDNKIKGIKIFKVDNHPVNDKYVILSDDINNVSKLNKDGIFSQLKFIFNELNPKSIFNAKIGEIDSYISQIISLSYNVYDKLGFTTMSGFKLNYNYYVVSKTETKLLSEVDGIEKGDLETIYNERLNLHPKIDFLIKNLLDVESSVNVPKNKDKISDIKLHFLNFINFSLQMKEKSTTTYLLKSVQGAGKDLFGEILVEFFGNSLTKITSEVLTGTFNGIVSNMRFIIGNEIMTDLKGRETMGTKIKSFISDEIDNSRKMYADYTTERQIHNSIFFTNESEPFKIETGDRRINVIHGSTSLKDALKREYNIDFEDMEEKFIIPLRLEIYEFLKTLLLSKVNKGYAKNITINNEAKNQIIRATNKRSKQIKDIVNSNDLESLDEYFFEYIDDEEYKIFKSQVNAGFFDNPSSEFLYNVLSEYEFKSNTSFKIQKYLDDVFSVRKSRKYKKVCGSESSMQIRMLPHYNQKVFNDYMTLYIPYKEGKTGLIDNLLDFKSIEDLESIGNNAKVTETTDSVDIEKLKEQIRNEMKSEYDALFNAKVKDIENFYREKVEMYKKDYDECIIAESLIDDDTHKETSAIDGVENEMLNIFNKVEFFELNRVNMFDTYNALNKEISKSPISKVKGFKHFYKIIKELEKQEVSDLQYAMHKLSDDMYYIDPKCKGNAQYALIFQMFDIVMNAYIDTVN